MAANRKSTTDNSIPEDLKPYYEGRNTAWRRWVGPVLRGVLLLVLIGLIVWGGIWGINKLVHRNSDDDGSTASNNSSSQSGDTSKDNSAASDDQGDKTAPAPAPAPTPSPSASSGDTGDDTGSEPSAPSDTASPSTTPAPAASDAENSDDSQLANTGPGEVLATFFVTVVIATLAYHLIAAYRVTGTRR